MKRHLKSCTGESPDMTSQLDDENSYKDVDPTIKINGTKGWRKGKSKYTPYYYINKEIGQVNITTISQKKRIFNFTNFFFRPLVECVKILSDVQVETLGP